MSQSKIQQRSSDSANELGDETFMSATELRNYVMQTEMAKASREVGSSGGAEKAREELIRSLMQPVVVTPEKNCRGKEEGARPTEGRGRKTRQRSFGDAFPECVVHG